VPRADDVPGGRDVKRGELFWLDRRFSIAGKSGFILWQSDQRAAWIAHPGLFSDNFHF
jgi:hypothetical protein